MLYGFSFLGSHVSWSDNFKNFDIFYSFFTSYSKSLLGYLNEIRSTYVKWSHILPGKQLRTHNMGKKKKTPTGWKTPQKNTQIPGELEKNLDQIKIAAPKKLHAFQF